MPNDPPHSLEVLRLVLNEAFGLQLPADQESLDLELPESLSLSVSLSSDGRELVLYSVLQSMATAADVVLLAAALSLNLHQEATRGGAIGLDAQAGALVYSFRLTADADMAQVIGALDDFCGVALDLSARLQAELDAMPVHERQRLERAASGLSALGEPDAENVLAEPAERSTTTMIKV